jgi:protein-S-isoprenylcysteine O-methyltransferase Ste14
MIERAMFLGSIQLKKPEFIGVWLAFKVASQWARWADEKSAGQRSKSGVAHGREFYNIFLFGNALSIVFATVCAVMIEWLSAGDILFSLVVALAVIIGSVILVIYVQRKAKKTKGYAE